MIKAVVFDLDGLIFNTEDVYIRATTEYLKPRGMVFEEDVRKEMMGQQSHVSTAILKEYYGLEETVEEIRSQISYQFMKVLPEIIALMPGFEDLISRLNTAGIPAAVCTSSSSGYARSLLSEFGFLDCFDFIIGGEMVPNGKPAPDCYLMSCEKLGFEVSEVMVLEDSENGCRAAIDAGTFAVGVPSVHNEGHNYTGAAIVARTLADPAIYEALGI